ncbi:MAG: META domain-containing protein [Candidatus Limnocylindrales bacterium]
MSTRTFGAIGAFVVIAAMACSACTVAGGSTPSPAGGSGGTLDGTDWQLRSFPVGGTLTAVPAAVTVTAAFTGARVAGSSGCNQYTAAYTTNGATITISPAAGTMMACPDPQMEVETTYLAALAQAATFTATATDLTMYAADGSTLLKYASTPVVPITTGTWHATAVNNGTGGVVSVPAGVDLTATFGSDGTVTGFSGCNTFSGPYTLTGDTISIGPLATTRKACAADAMALETQYLAALQASKAAELAPTTLGLRDAGGATQAQFVRRTS